MERKLAELVVKNLKGQNGLTLTVLEAMSMTPVKNDGYEVYAIQKGDVTFLALVADNKVKNARVQTVAW